MIAPLYRICLAAAVAVAAAACAGDPGGAKVPLTRANGKVAIAPNLPVTNLVSDKGAGIIAHNGAGIIGKVKIPAGIITNNGSSLISDHGVGVVSENSSGLISDNGGSLISLRSGYAIGKTKYALRQVTEDLPLAEVAVTITAADGSPIRDVTGKPYLAWTDRAGAYRFAHTPTGRNFLVKVVLPPAVGDMVALLPQDRGANDVTVDARSTLVMGFIGSAFVKGNGEILDRLPGDVEAETRAQAATALAAASAATPINFLRASLEASMGTLRAASPALDAQVEKVKALLLLGQSNLGDGTLATKTALNLPASVAFGPDGRLVINDRLNNRLRAVDADGLITTFAGNGRVGLDGDGGPATEASLYNPEGMLFDKNGDLYLADARNHVVRVIHGPNSIGAGTIDTVAGDNSQNDTFTGEGANARTVYLGRPGSLALGPDGTTVYVADFDRGMVFALTTAAHNDKGVPWLRPVVGADPRTTPLITGPFPTGLAARAWRCDAPSGLGVAKDGTLYLTAKNTADVNRSDLYAVDPAGTVRQLPLGGPEATLALVRTIVFDPQGRLVLTDKGHHRIARVDPSDPTFQVTTIMGKYGEAGTGSETGGPLDVRLGDPEGVAFDGQGRLVVADGGHNLIRRLEADGRMTILAGVADAAQVGTAGADLALARPAGILTTRKGDLLVADGFNAVVRRREADGRLSIFAGTGAKGSTGDGGPAKDATFGNVAGLAEDAAGNLYVVDINGGRVRKIRPDGTIATLASGFVEPGGVGADAKGNVYVSLGQADRVVKIAPDGTTTELGLPGAKRSGGDGGPATKAAWNFPGGISVDAQDNVYVAEIKGQRIRRIAPDGTVSTHLVSQAATPASGEATTAPKAGFAAPGFALVDAAGITWVADSLLNRVLRVTPDGTTAIIAGPGGRIFDGEGVDDGLRQPLGLAFDRDGNLVVVDSGNNQIKQIPKDLLGP